MNERIYIKIRNFLHFSLFIFIFNAADCHYKYYLKRSKHLYYMDLTLMTTNGFCQIIG
jgi:hypothetical protein